MTELYPPIGQMVDVGGHRLHLCVMGEGSPTVVFESGGASWSLDWCVLQTQVAGFTRAVAYDRAGFGWSEPGAAGAPRTAGQIASELHALLKNAGIPGPYLLVGASFGGHPVRLFARDHPDEVAGVILLDARHEDFTIKIPGWKKMEASGRATYQFLLFAARSGLLKLLGKVFGERAVPPAVSTLPAELRPVYMAVGFQPKYFQANLDELAACAESDRQVKAAGSLGDIPLTVIRHGVPDLFGGLSKDQAAQAEQAWQEMQADLARLSTRGRLLVAGRSGHGIHVDQPELVVEAIQQMVQKLKG